MAESGVWSSVKPYILMIFLQFGYAGMSVVSIASLKKGMNHYVLAVYRNAVAVAVVAPFALWLEGKVRPKMTLKIFIKIMALALLEPVLDQNFYYMGAKKTSASFAAALYNILPAITFLNAIILCMEKIKIKERRSQAKIIGTLVTVVGALVMILYKGTVIEFAWTKGPSHHAVADSHDQTEWLTGTFMLIFSCFCWSCFFVLQANTLKSYPAPLSLSTLICALGASQGTAIALVAEHGNFRPWILGWDMRLFTAVYSGIMCSGVAFFIQGEVSKERGPVFVTAFNPLCMFITALMGSIILSEDITAGMVIGAVIIVIGLYSLIWGKGRDYLTQDVEKSELKNKGLELPKSMNDVVANP